MQGQGEKSMLHIGWSGGSLLCMWIWAVLDKEREAFRGDAYCLICAGKSHDAKSAVCVNRRNSTGFWIAYIDSLFCTGDATDFLHESDFRGCVGQLYNSSGCSAPTFIGRTALGQIIYAPVSSLSLWCPPCSPVASPLARIATLLAMEGVQLFYVVHKTILGDS
jgi:hypothetical protein